MDLSEFNTLKCLQWFDQLCELNLDSNNIDDHSEFPILQSLVHLSLSNNNICNLELFLEKSMTSFPKLQYLNILGNPICPLSINSKSERKLQQEIVGSISTARVINHKYVKSIRKKTRKAAEQTRMEWDPIGRIETYRFFDTSQRKQQGNKFIGNEQL